jgi:hypothetical protein
MANAVAVTTPAAIRLSRKMLRLDLQKMNPAEVIAIEVKQYLGADGTKTLVPRVIGRTAEVEARKGRRTSSERRQWDEQSLFGDLLDRRGDAEMRAARDLYDWTLARGWRPTFGAGKQDGSWVPVLAANGREHYPIALYSYGRIEVQFQHLKARPPFDDEQTRLELLRRMNEIAGVSLGPDVITRRPASSACSPMIPLRSSSSSACSTGSKPRPVARSRRIASPQPGCGGARLGTGPRAEPRGFTSILPPGGRWDRSRSAADSPIDMRRECGVRRSLSSSLRPAARNCFGDKRDLGIPASQPESEPIAFAPDAGSGDPARWTPCPNVDACLGSAVRAVRDRHQQSRLRNGRFKTPAGQPGAIASSRKAIT